MLNCIYRYEAAGDQYVGRVLSGLPIFSSKFATLPPHFPSTDNVVVRAINISFPHLQYDEYLRKMRKVCELCLASIVFHLEFLQKTLPVDHIMYENAIFREPELLEHLTDCVVCRLPTSQDDIRPTGMIM